MARNRAAKATTAEAVPTVPGNGDSRPRKRPRARSRWLAGTRHAFVAFWDEPVSRLVAPAAEALVVRYFELVDQHQRALRRVHAEPIVAGSKGQKAMNPMARFLLDVEAALSRLESELGIGPASRSRLRLEE